MPVVCPACPELPKGAKSKGYKAAAFHNQKCGLWPIFFDIFSFSEYIWCAESLNSIIISALPEGKGKRRKP